MNSKSRNFSAAMSLAGHPLMASRRKLKARYYQSLEYFVKQIATDTEYTNVRLGQYRDFLVGNETLHKLSDEGYKEVIRSIVNNPIKPWRRKYRYWLLCDIALILLDRDAIDRSLRFMQSFLSRRQAALLQSMHRAIWIDDEVTSAFAFTEPLLAQFRENRRFFAHTEKRFVVTANMSAGKSTLINAIIGKPLTRTSQEVCTGNLCYLYNKPFEDKTIHFSGPPLKLDASREDLIRLDQAEVSSIASHFRTMASSDGRVCVIDTPGVNSAINRQHGKITKKALVEGQYDLLIYIFNANKLGTDEEMRYLKWVAENMPREKVVFVLNKIDDFKRTEDSIEASMNGVKNDLRELGFENPIVYPLSAYFAYLIKLKMHGEPLSEDETDAYDAYVRKFSRPEYDLSKYYDGVNSVDSDSEPLLMSKRCGIYGLETLLFGGSL